MRRTLITAAMFRLLGVVLLLPFLALTLIPAQVMLGRGADGMLTIVLCVDGGTAEVTIDLATGKPAEQAPAADRCDWASAQMAVADLAAPAIPVLMPTARRASTPIPTTTPALARATRLPPATGPPALI